MSKAETMWSPEETTDIVAVVRAAIPDEKTKAFCAPMRSTIFPSTASRVGLLYRV